MNPKIKSFNQIAFYTRKNELIFIPTNTFYNKKVNDESKVSEKSFFTKKEKKISFTTKLLYTIKNYKKSILFLDLKTEKDFFLQKIIFFYFHLVLIKKVRKKKQFIFFVKKFNNVLIASVNDLIFIENVLYLKLFKKFNITNNKVNILNYYFFVNYSLFFNDNFATKKTFLSENTNPKAFKGILSHYFFYQLNIVLNEKKAYNFFPTYFQKTEKSNLTNTWAYKKYLNIKFLESIFFNKYNLRIKTRIIKKFFINKNNTNNNDIRKIIWKNNNLSFNSFNFYFLVKPNSFFSPNSLKARNPNFNISYVISRIEEKITILKKQNLDFSKLVLLRNLILTKWKNKVHRQRGLNLIISTARDLKKFQNSTWKQTLKKILFEKINSSHKLKIKKILELLLTKNIENKKKTNVTFHKTLFNQNLFWKKPLKIRLNLKNKKVVFKNNVKEYYRYQKVLSLLSNKKVSIFYINAVSLSRFAFKLENPSKNSKAFLENVERELVNRYKYVATYIQDLVQVSFISLLLKKPTFLSKFIAFQIEKLPRNRKETKLIKFIIKTVKIFAAQRKETLGIRLRFKGRVNRWRRTKAIIGDRGTVNLQTINERIEYGSSKAVTRKGTLGISFWIRYSPYFQTDLEKIFKTYIKYSKFLYTRKIKKYLYNYNNNIFKLNK